MKTQISDLVCCLVNISEKLARRDEKVTTVKCFTQTWGSTALGFNYCGGDSITEAYTIVINTVSGKYYISFDGKLAYIVRNPNEAFKEDLKNCTMASCNQAVERYNING